MKPRKLKTLKLRKETIANLEKNELTKVKGGACTHDWSGCDTINRPCCSVGLEWSCDYPPVKDTVTCSFPTCDTYCTIC
jgi:natural product precursor